MDLKEASNNIPEDINEAESVDSDEVVLFERRSISKRIMEASSAAKFAVISPSLLLNLMAVLDVSGGHMQYMITSFMYSTVLYFIMVIAERQLVFEGRDGATSHFKNKYKDLDLLSKSLIYKSLAENMERKSNNLSFKSLLGDKWTKQFFCINLIIFGSLYYLYFKHKDSPDLKEFNSDLALLKYLMVFIPVLTNYDLFEKMFKSEVQNFEEEVVYETESSLNPGKEACLTLTSSEGNKGELTEVITSGGFSEYNDQDTDIELDFGDVMKDEQDSVMDEEIEVVELK